MKKMVAIILALTSTAVSAARADGGRYVMYQAMTYIPICIHTGDEIDVALQPDDGSVVAIGMPDPRYEPHSTVAVAGVPHVVIKAKSAVSDDRKLTVMTEKRTYHFSVTSGDCPTQFVVFQAPYHLPKAAPVATAAPTPVPTPTLASLTSCPVPERYTQSGSGLKYFPVSLVCAWEGRTFVMLAYVPRELPPVYVVENKQDQIVANPTYNSELHEFVLDGEQDHLALVVDSNEGKRRLDIVRGADPKRTPSPKPTAAVVVLATPMPTPRPTPAPPTPAPVRTVRPTPSPAPTRMVLRPTVAVPTMRPVAFTVFVAETPSPPPGEAALRSRPQVRTTVPAQAAGRTKPMARKKMPTRRLAIDTVRPQPKTEPYVPRVAPPTPTGWSLPTCSPGGC